MLRDDSENKHYPLFVWRSFHSFCQMKLLCYFIIQNGNVSTLHTLQINCSFLQNKNSKTLSQLFSLFNLKSLHTVSCSNWKTLFFFGNIFVQILWSALWQTSFSARKSLYVLWWVMSWNCASQEFSWLAIFCKWSCPTLTKRKRESSLLFLA